VLDYSHPEGTRASFARSAWIIASAAILSIISFVIFCKSTTDSGPYSPSFDESFCYLGLGSAVIVLWPLWAGFFATSLIRRKLKPAWTVVLIAGICWGALLCSVLYDNAAAFIDQTTRITGGSWPVLEKVFRRWLRRV